MEEHSSDQRYILFFIASFQAGAALEVWLTEEEEGRVGLSYHLALYCLCDSWNAF